MCALALHHSLGLGSAGCQPAVSGSLPDTDFLTRKHKVEFGVVGKLPTTAGWQPALQGELHFTRAVIPGLYFLSRFSPE